jgi:hypothetical protein
MRASLSIIALMAILTGTGRGDDAASRPVARVGQRTIVYREIRCTLTANGAYPPAPDTARDPAAICLDDEQKRLDLLLSGELHQAGAKKAGIEVTPDDLKRDSAFHGYGDAEYARLSQRYRALGQAVARVHRGEDAGAVYAELRSAASFTGEQFRDFVARLDSAEAAEQFVNRHSPEHFRTSILADARRRIARDKLMVFLDAEARRRAIPFDVYAKTFWREVIAEAGLEILDPRYRSVSVKGLSWQSRQVQ